MARAGTKAAGQLIASSVVGPWLLDRVSKAALVDLYLQALACALGHPDAPVTLEQLKTDADPLLRLRADRTLTSIMAADLRRGRSLPTEEVAR